MLVNQQTRALNVLELAARLVRITLLCCLVVSGALAEDVEEWKLSGDVRLREEVEVNRPRKPERARTRLRLRVQLKGQPQPDLEFGFRARTGDPATPFGANLTLISSTPEKETYGFNLDQAYVRYHPGGDTGFNLVAGKSPQLFGANSPYGKLNWDTDYLPAGLWLGYQGEHHAFRAGHFELDALPRYLAYRLELLDYDGRVPLGEGVELWASLAYYHFSQTGDPALLAASLAANRGNATVDRNGDGKPDDYRSRFHLLEPEIALRFPIGDLPSEVGVYYVRNLGSAIPADQAFATGFQLGRCKQAGDWDVFYRYQTVGQDAVFTPVAQDDLPLASNFFGHVAGAQIQLTDEMRLDPWVLTATPRSLPGPTQVRYRLDLNYQF